MTSAALSNSQTEPAGNDSTSRGRRTGWQAWLLVLFAPAIPYLFTWGSFPRSEPVGHLQVSISDRKALAVEAARAQLREEGLAVELRGSIPAWAGTYRFDSDDVEWITVAPRWGAVLASKDFDSVTHGSVRVRNHGDVEEIAPGRLRVHWRVPPEAMSTFYAGKQASYGGDLIVVPWGRRDVLVPVDRMIEFCERVADGTEWIAREDRRRFATRLVPERGDEDSDAAPIPGVPEEFRAYLNPPNLTTPVVEAVPADWSRPRERNTLGFASVARLRVGRADGVLPGMTFFWGWSTNYAEGEVTALTENTCTVLFRHGAIDSSVSPPLASGVLVSTHRPAYYARDRH